MTALQPGAVLGILGGGQLARMLAYEARTMGFRVAVLDPDPRCAAAAMADVLVTGAFDDARAAVALAEASDVVTLDTEHVPAEVLVTLEQSRPVRPSSRVLGTIQDRASQRRFLTALGAPQPAHVEVDDVESLTRAVARLGLPCVLKTRRSGYDGKGQARIDDVAHVQRAWDSVGAAPCVLEAFVDFEREVSVVLARSLGGEVRCYPLVDNLHRNHILHATVAPSALSDTLTAQAQALATQIAQALDHVGVLAVEFFVTREGTLLVNEVAPRTHNSGHYTLGAAVTSQFQQHVRAVMGLPLGDSALLCPALMVNLMGDLWAHGAPNFEAVLAQPGAHLHLYGKAEPRPGRKMGHVLRLLQDADRALDACRAVEQALASFERR